MRTPFLAMPAAGLLAAAVLAGCSSSPTPAANAGAPAAAQSSTAAPAALDAQGVVAKLKAAGLPIGTVTVYTADTDPNKLLGRPGGYTSKAAFTDTRINPSDARDSSSGSVDLGGSVEVFASNGDATARQQYIATAEKSAPILGTEYDYVAGSALLRVSQVLTPAQAAAYQKAFG